MREIAIAPDAPINWLSAEQSNSSLIVGEAAMLKLFRRVVSGPHPEAEMGRYLTEHGYANTPPLLGEMVRVDAAGTRHTLAVAQGFIRNQGDAWNWTLEWLMRALSDIASKPDDGRRQRLQGIRNHRHADRPAVWPKCIALLAQPTRQTRISRPSRPVLRPVGTGQSR